MQKTIVLLGRRWVLALGLLAAASASQAAYPERPITLVVPFAAGSSIDVVARATAEGMRQALGQPVVIENRPGAAGNLGHQAVAGAKPDGYTLLFTLNTLATNPHMYKGSKYDPVKSFAPVGLAAWGTHIALVAKSSIGVNSVADFITYLKANPGKLNYGSAGAGTPHHLSMELFKDSMGVDLVHVPYRSANDMLFAIERGDVDVAFLSVTQAVPLAKEKKLRILAIESDTPWPDAPGIPLFKDQGLPAFKFEPWYGLLAPAGTPADIVQTLNAAMVRGLSQPKVVASLRANGQLVSTGTPQEFAALIQQDTERWGVVIRKVGINLN